MKKLFGRKDAVTPYRDPGSEVAPEGYGAVRRQPSIGHGYGDQQHAQWSAAAADPYYSQQDYLAAQQDPAQFSHDAEHLRARAASPAAQPHFATRNGELHGLGQSAGGRYPAYSVDAKGLAESAYPAQPPTRSPKLPGPRRRASGHDLRPPPQASSGSSDMPPSAHRQPRQGSLDMRKLATGGHGVMPAFHAGSPPAEQPLRNGLRTDHVSASSYPTPASPVIEPPTPIEEASHSPRLGRWRSLRKASEGARERFASRDGKLDESAFYPSYAPPDQAREVLYQGNLPHEHVSHERRHEAMLQQEQLQDKPKRKLFGFGRDKRDKEQEQHSQLVNNGAGQEFADARLARESASSQTHAQSQVGQANGQAKEPAWYDLVTGNRVTPAKGEGLVHTKIGWLCARPAEAWDWSYLMSLVDSISHSEAASKEAARALRKEFKYGDVEPRKRATKIWAVLALNGSDRFKLQIADKKFLAVVEEVITSHKTPISVKEQLIEVFGMLAFEFKDDSELHSVTKSYNRIRPSDRPLDGTPLDPEHEIFRPAAVTSGAAQAQMAMQANGAQRHGPRSRKPRSAGEEMARLHRECVLARESAQMLVENVAEAGMDSVLVAEFSAKTLDSEEFLIGQIPWATAQADRSRANLEAQLAQERSEGRPASAISQTQEERLLADLLDAHERVVQAREMLGHVQTQHQQEDEDERLAIERSRYETRVDRTKLQQDALTGDLYSVDAGRSLAAPVMEAQGSSSSSRPPSPAQPAHRPLPVPSPVGSSEGAGHSAHSISGLSIGGRLHNPSAHTRELSASSASSGRGPRELRPEGPRPASLVPGGHALPHGPRPLPTTAGVVSPPSKSNNATRNTASPTPGALPSAPETAQRRPDQEAIAGHTGARAAALPPVEALKLDGQAMSAASAPGAPRFEDDNESVIVTPVQPSAKALGKRRQVSGDSADQPPGTTAPIDTRLASSPRLSPVQDEKRLSKEDLLTRPPPAVPAEYQFAAPQPQSPPQLASNNPFLNHTTTASRPGDAQTVTNPFLAQQ